jgi:hypothetical protein
MRQQDDIGGARLIEAAKNYDSKWKFRFEANDQPESPPLKRRPRQTGQSRKQPLLKVPRRSSYEMNATGFISPLWQRLGTSGFGGIIITTGCLAACFVIWSSLASAY